MEILWLEDAACVDASRVGGKAASLALLAAEHHIPPAFAVTTVAFERWGSLRHADAGGVASPEMLETIRSAYDELAQRCAAAVPAVAVRSSAVDEDGADASFAGQHDTFLNVTGAEAVANSVIRCWASLDSEVARSYRAQNGLDTANAQMGVVVQHMVLADVAGVAFSANPVTGALDEVVLNASWGLGESVVSGTVTPDSFTVHKGSGDVISRLIAEKARMTVRVEDGTNEVDVPRIMRSAPSLRDEQVAEVAALAISLERSMGWPVDIEWAFAGDELFLLQCRPVTTLA